MRRVPWWLWGLAFVLAIGLCAYLAVTYILPV